MKNWLLVTLILLAGTNAFGTALPAQDASAMIAQTISESPAGITVEFNFNRGDLQTIDNGESTRLWYNMPGGTANFESDGPILPAFTRMIAVPVGYKVEAEVIRREETRYNAERVLPRDEMVRDVRRVETKAAIDVGDVGWMRWMRIAPVAIHPAYYDNGNHQIVAADRMTVNFRFVPDDSPVGNIPDPERYYSLAFDEYFQAVMLNPDQMPNTMQGGGILTRGSYLIITDTLLAPYCEEFAEWKRCKGFNVVIDPFYYHGLSAEDLRTHIKDAYDNWARPPEFILLVGDINMPGIQMPAFRIENPNDQREYDVTDLPYVLLRGEDYFPEAFIGRISTDSPTTSVVRNVFQRTLDYEKQTYMKLPGDVGYDDYIQAFHSATIFAGNFGDGNRLVLSPVETSQWLAERLTDRGWDVETFYYRGRQGDPRSSGPIIESINRQVNVVSYRGWADARGTHYPEFYKADLEQLDNGPLLPVFTFFVCNTGDFGNDNQNPCFGEYAAYQGSRRRPAGALAFYGPSDLHTSTRYNNPMLAGYYSSLMDLNIRTLGAVTLGAKMEVWRGFPHQRVMNAPQNNYVEFYFSVYNILGDPEVQLFFDPPTALSVDFPEEIAIGTSHLPFRVTSGNNPIFKAIVHVKAGDNTISLLTDLDGIANVPVDITEAGEVSFTVSSLQCAPVQDTIAVAQAADMIGIANIAVSNEFGDDRMVSGSLVDFTVTLHNFGENDATGITTSLVTEIPSVNIDAGEVTFGDIASGQNAEGQSAFTVTITPQVWPYSQLPFYLTINDDQGNTYTAQFRLPMVNHNLQYIRHDFTSVPEAGADVELVLTMANWGNLASEELRAELYSFDNAVSFPDAEGTFPALEPGARGTNADDAFTIHFGDEIINGRRISLRMSYLDSQDRPAGVETFTIKFGTVTPADPLGPDAYGYYIYEESDDDRFADFRPTYNWIELDPEFGGHGAVYDSLPDDSVHTMNLPFTFTYYGRDFNDLTICSNGWISFINTWMFNFRNWNLPSLLGPHTLVAPFWEDLVGELNGGARDPLNIYTRYDENEGRFIIQWSRVVARTSDADHTETFEVILYDPAVHPTTTGDGIIDFQYLDFALVDFNEGNYASIGMEDWNHYRGLQVTFAGQYDDAITPLTGGRALRISTETPDPYLSTGDETAELPTAFGLNGVYPNPFNSTTHISFALPEAERISISLWDLNGRLVQIIADRNFSIGQHEITYNADALTSGLYIIRLAGNGKADQQKVLLLR